MNTVNAATTVNVTATAVTTITGTAAQLATTYGGGMTGLGNEAITVSDTSITSAQANTIDAYTTGAVTATISTTAIADLDDLTGTGNAYTITVGDSSVTAAALNTVNAATTVNVTATAVTTITGTAAQLATTYGGGITGLGNEAITLSDTSISASTLNSLDGDTTGVINASNVTTITGTYSQITTAQSIFWYHWIRRCKYYYLWKYDSCSG